MRTAIHLTLAAVAATFLLAPPAADAQSRLSLELRGSLNNPVGDFGGEVGLDATSEAGFGAHLLYNASPNLSVYGGWAREMFGCETCSDDEGIHTQGFEGGVKLLAARASGVLPWIRAGLVAHELTVDRDALDATSDLGVGFQAAAGVDIPLGQVLSFSPAVRYQAWDAEFDVLGDDFIEAERTVQHLALDLGLHIHLGALGSR